MGRMDWQEFASLIVSGLVAGADFGSFVLVYPIIRGLPDPHRVKVHQRLLAKSERLFPVLVLLAAIFVINDALHFAKDSPANRAVWGAVFCFATVVAASIWFNQPIHQTINGWNPEQLPDDWKAVEARSTLAHGVRSTLQLIGFGLLCISVALR